MTYWLENKKRADNCKIIREKVSELGDRAENQGNVWRKIQKKTISHILYEL